MALRYVTEQSNLVLDGLIQRMLTSADDDIRLDAHALQILNTGLGGFGLQFLRSAQIRNQRYMDQNRIVMADFMLELTNGLQERLALDITYGTADLDDGDTGLIIRKIAVETALDLIGDMRDDLYRTSAVITTTLFLQYGPVYFTGGDIGILIQVLIDETLIMSQIQIGLCTIFCDEYLAMLDRVHGAGINIDIRIEFLHGYLITSCL